MFGGCNAASSSLLRGGSFTSVLLDFFFCFYEMMVAGNDEPRGGMGVMLLAKCEVGNPTSVPKVSIFSLQTTALEQLAYFAVLSSMKSIMG